MVYPRAGIVNGVLDLSCVRDEFICISFFLVFEVGVMALEDVAGESKVLYRWAWSD